MKGLNQNINEICLNKVPEVTISFWIIKILSTTVGETGADYLSVNAGFGIGVTSIFVSIMLILILLIQILLKRYIPLIYWLAVVLVSVAGTLITDILTVKLEVSLYISSLVFSVFLILTLLGWYRSEKSLSMQSITTRKREAYYWLTILLTFALGTAAGDLAAEVIGLGFKLGVGVFTAMIALAFGAYRLGLNSITVFWVVYILTRPLGACLGDLLTQSPDYGGLGFGATKTSVLFLIVIVLTVIFLSIKENKNLRLTIHQ